MKKTKPTIKRAFHILTPCIQTRATICERLIGKEVPKNASFATIVRLTGLDPSKDFRGAVLPREWFTHLGSQLRGFNFSGAHLADTKWRGTSVDDINFEGADLWNATGLPSHKIERAIISESTKLPDHLYARLRR
jgi:uncharacterized protein YjbI with pentapeptide repeats